MFVSRREFCRTILGVAAGASFAGKDWTSHADEPTIKVDCHTHLYDPSRPQGVPWPGKDDDVLYRTVLPKQFLEQAAPVGVTKTVVVEASPWLEDNAWLLDLAPANPSIAGVVGHLSPGTPEFAGHLKRFSPNPLFRGIRVSHNDLQAGLNRPEYLGDLRRFSEQELTLDVNGGPDMPPVVARLAEQFPDLRIVINHLANVDNDGGPPPRDWLTGMRSAAKFPRVYCKVSALVEHAKPKSGSRKAPDDVGFYRPILDAAWATFGEDRLIYGSNWPVSDRFASYKTLFTIVDQYVRTLGHGSAEKFYAKNAQVAYGIRL